MQMLLINIIACFFTLILSVSAHSSCSTSAMRVSSGSSFVLSSSGSSGAFNQGLETRQEIPFSYNGVAACWEQKSQLKFELESDLEEFEFRGKLRVYLPESKFKNVEGGKVYSYMFLSSDIESRNNTDVTIEVANFTCIENQVLSVGSFSGTFGSAQKLSEQNSGASFFMATGSVAENLLKRQKLALMKKGPIPFLPKNLSYFLNQSINEEEMVSSTDNTLKLPSFYKSMKLYQDNLTDINSESSTIAINNFGCSSRFIEIMKPYSIENLVKVGRQGPFRIREKGYWSRDYIRVTWW